MITAKWLKKACSVREMKEMYNPFDPLVYSPFGAAPGEPKGSLEDLVDAYNMDVDNRYASDVDWKV